MVRLVTVLFQEIINNNKKSKYLKRYYKNLEKWFGKFKFIDFSSPLILACKYNNDFDFIKYLVEEAHVDINYQIEIDDDDGEIYSSSHRTLFMEGESAIMVLALSKINDRNRVLDLLMKWS